MSNNPDKHHRQAIRLRAYDYSAIGSYFVTICTQERECYLGNIDSGEMILSLSGKIARDCISGIPVHFKNVLLDEFVIMPNHIHAIITITGRTGLIARAGLMNQTPTTHGQCQKQKTIHHTPATDWISMKNPAQTLGRIIRHFKGRASRYIRENGLIYFQWQRNYYDRIIRNEKELTAIREYIRHNPAQWASDNNNPEKE